MRRFTLAFLLCLLPGVTQAQSPAPPTWQSKLKFHAASAYSPWQLVGTAAYAGFLQEVDFPTEWGQGAAGYGKRLGSTLGYSGIRNTIGFGLDTALRQDPRYYRSTETGLWRRVKYAMRETVMTRTDSGSETFATWRFGSAYGGTFLSNEWYPDRVNTVKIGLLQGSEQIGFDFLGNLGSEFWPDVKNKFHRH